MANITIKEIREKYPQYDDLSDQDLTDKLHAKFYSDMDKSEFYNKVGFNPPAEKPKDEMPEMGWKDFSHLVPEAKNLAGGILDSFSRAGTALGEAGQFMSNTPLTRSINKAIPDWMKFVSPEAQKVDIRSLTGADQGGQDILGDRASETYQVGKQLGDAGLSVGLGGTSKLGMGLGAGATGVLTANPDQELFSSHIPGIGKYMPKGRLANGIENAILTMLAPGAASLTAKAVLPVAEKIGLGGRTALDVAMPNRLSQDVLKELGGGQSLEEHGKQLSGNLKSSYEGQKSRISNDYNQFFKENKLGEKELYPEQIKYTKEGRVKVGDEMTRNMPEFPSGLESDEYQAALKKFNSKPNVINGHELQSQLASEERLLQRQYDAARARGESTRDISRDLSLTRKSREKLLKKMHDTMGDAAEDYKAITADFLKNQVPYYGDRSLRQIIKGNLTNPKRSNFNSIFQNPDEEVNTILEHLGPESGNDVLFQKLGIQPDDATAGQLISRAKTARAGGYESYPSEQASKNIGRVKLADKIRDYILPNRWIRKGLK